MTKVRLARSLIREQEREGGTLSQLVGIAGSSGLQRESDLSFQQNSRKNFFASKCFTISMQQFFEGVGWLLQGDNQLFKGDKWLFNVMYQLFKAYSKSS